MFVLFLIHVCLFSLFAFRWVEELRVHITTLRGENESKKKKKKQT